MVGYIYLGYSIVLCTRDMDKEAVKPQETEGRVNDVGLFRSAHLRAWSLEFGGIWMISLRPDAFYILVYIHIYIYMQHVLWFPWRHSPPPFLASRPNSTALPSTSCAPPDPLFVSPPRRPPVPRRFLPRVTRGEDPPPDDHDVTSILQDDFRRRPVLLSLPIAGRHG